MRISSEGDGGCCCCTFEGLAGVDGGTMATRRSAGRGMASAQTRREQRWPGQANAVWGMLVLRQPREVRQMDDEAGR
jgi:hypothetical protein